MSADEYLEGEDEEEEIPRWPIEIQRMGEHPETHLAMEAVTRMQAEIDRHNYCAFHLANFFLHGKLLKMEMSLPEFEDEVPVRVMLTPAGREKLKSSLYHWNGYSYTPMNEAEGFGYASGNVAWIIPYDKAPVIFYRHDIEGYEAKVIDWLGYHAAILEAGTVKIENIKWPKITEDNNHMVTPVSFRRKRIRRYIKDGKIHVVI